MTPSTYREIQSPKSMTCDWPHHARCHIISWPCREYLERRWRIPNNERKSWENALLVPGFTARFTWLTSTSTRCNNKYEYEYSYGISRIQVRMSLPYYISPARISMSYDASRYGTVRVTGTLRVRITCWEILLYFRISSSGPQLYCRISSHDSCAVVQYCSD